MSTTSFADYVATQDARNTIQLNVRKHTLTLCDVLKQNYITYCIKMHQRSQSVEDPTGYHQECIDKLKNGESDYDFFIEEGRKYHKIVMDAHGSKSVHAFVDKKTGEVYKAASYKAPAKIVRYNLLVIASREECFSRADWAGSYLYLR